MTDMTYTTLGHTGLIVSRIALGTMTFNLGAGKSDMAKAVAHVDQKGATKMVARAIDRGVNFFDSADGYASGDGERALGVALKGKRDGVVISTKAGFRQSETITDAGLSRRHLLRQIDGSLERMKTDYVDVFIVHKTDFTTPMEETLAALETIVQHGKARYIGFSNWPAWQAARAIQYQRDNGMAQFATGQLLYNFVQRDIETDLLPMMSAMGAGLMAWSPLSGGLLSGKYDPEDIGASKDGRLVDFNFLGFDPKVAKKALATLAKIAKAHDVSVATAALAWILARDRSHTVIAGASKMAHLDAAIDAAGVTFSDAEMKTLNDAAPVPVMYPQSFATRMTDGKHKDALA